MTKAICIECGEEKLGAWTLCASCSFKPQTADDFMKSIALSEWYADDRRLMQWKVDIQAGVRPLLDDRAREVLSGSLTLHTAHGEFNPVLNFPFDDSTMAAWRERNPDLVDVRFPDSLGLPSCLRCGADIEADRCPICGL